MNKTSDWAVFVAAGAIVAACGSSSSGSFDGGTSSGSSQATSGSAASGSENGSGGGSGGPSGAASGFSSGSSSSDASVGFFSQDATTSADAFAGCAGETVAGLQLPLDLYFMIDSSSSMSDLVAAGESKWSALGTAMTSFLNDPSSAGIGVGLQYFPLNSAGVPATCTTSAQCAAAGPCLLNACDFSVFTEVYPCDPTHGTAARSTDCEGCDQNGKNCQYYACNPIGYCSLDPNSVCAGSSASMSCGMDANKFPLGTCEAYTTSTCTQGDSCAPADYAAPAVAIAPLPGVGSAVTASLAAHKPNGNTPTSAALQGALNEARTFATANPGHVVVAVLATDGVPDECTPTDTAGISQIASTALGGTPSIKTFTIGVFTPDDITSGTATLNSIAMSGGTQQAFIINSTSGNVEQQFASALTAIRGASLPCQYEIPLPDSGQADFDRVNVEFTSGSGTTTALHYVETESNCDPTAGGWYYDVDPAKGGTPSAILVCPMSCTTLKGDAKGTVNILLGCATIPK